MKIPVNEMPGFQFKRIALLGMSGLGKTFISRNLFKSDNWSHYSVDYEIGKLLFKNEHENLFENFDIDNLTNLSNFLGKPGSSSKGGIPFSDYVSRQRLHRDAEKKATLNACSLIEKSPDLSKMVCDTSGSICELVNPSDKEDILLTSLSRNFLIICLEAPETIYQVLIDRFLARPKPMYYEENFLHSLWQTFKFGSTDTEDKINPDDFMIFGFKALIERRKAIFDMISKNWGITLNFEHLRKVKTGADLIEAIQLKIKSKTEHQ
jgi:hypothetical protein